MEKAILKTLIYADIFDYPLRSYEIHKWLIGKSASFQQIEKALISLLQQGKIKTKRDYYFLAGRARLVRERIQAELQSKRFLLKARLSAWLLKLIPFIKLVGISGGLSLNNAAREDDIDLFLITAKNRLWISRIMAIFILDVLGVRRNPQMETSQVAGKICINILIEEEKMEQANKDIFLAHEVLQMKVLWDRDNTYKKYLEKNSWVFEFLPNWIGPNASEGDPLAPIKSETRVDKNRSVTLLENLAKKFQLMIMKKPEGLERIENGALYFHPNDIRPQVLKDYKSRVKNII